MQELRIQQTTALYLLYQPVQTVMLKQLVLQLEMTFLKMEVWLLLAQTINLLKLCLALIMVISTHLVILMN